MFKKFIFWGGAAALVGFLVFSTAAVSHVQHGVRWVQTAMQDSVPVEHELERARDLLEEAGPALRKQNRVIAEKQVELRYLATDVNNLERKQDLLRNYLGQHASHLRDSSTTMVTVNGRTVRREALNREARNLLKRVKTNDRILESKIQRHDALASGLAHAEKQLETTKTKTVELRAKIELMEAKLQEHRAKNAAAGYASEIDSSFLAEVNDIIRDVSKRIDVEDQLRMNTAPIVGEEEFEIEVSADVVVDIEAYLSTGSDLVRGESGLATIPPVVSGQ